MNHLYRPPWGLDHGLRMTLYTAFVSSSQWQRFTVAPEPTYQPHIFTGAEGVPIYGIMAAPEQPKGTIVGTYGITGGLENQWFLQLLGRKAVAQGYAVVLFDWRAHGKTAELSPTLTSDGIFEGKDFVHLAATAKAMGYPAPFWFTGFSLGGQLALWGVQAAQTVSEWGPELNLQAADVAGGAVISPSLESNRSLAFLQQTWWGRQIEQSIARQLKKLAWALHAAHPGVLDPAAIARVHGIGSFDHELVIRQLGFPSVEEYYQTTSGLYLLPHLHKPTLILYAADDPLFDPTLVPELQAMSAANPALDLVLTAHGGHVGYLSSSRGQRQAQDPDPWWAWNRVLEWIEQRSLTPTVVAQREYC